MKKLLVIITSVLTLTITSNAFAKTANSSHHSSHPKKQMEYKNLLSKSVLLKGDSYRGIASKSAIPSSSVGDSSISYLSKVKNGITTNANNNAASAKGHAAYNHNEGSTNPLLGKAISNDLTEYKSKHLSSDFKT